VPLFDTRHELPGKQKCAVYKTAISGNNLDDTYDPVDDAGYTAYSSCSSYYINLYLVGSISGYLFVSN
jgi:hypothetical protein